MRRTQDPNITYHAKRSLDSVWCGKSIIGTLTNAEGYKVTCKECLDVLEKDKQR